MSAKVYNFYNAFVSSSKDERLQHYLKLSTSEGTVHGDKYLRSLGLPPSLRARWRKLCVSVKATGGMGELS